MRLDHLLSKEHLPAKVGKEPAPTECVGGVLIGGDTGEAAVGNGQRPSYCFAGLPFAGLLRGVWIGSVVRLVGSVQASCWVLREQALLALFSWFRP